MPLTLIGLDPPIAHSTCARGDILSLDLQEIRHHKELVIGPRQIPINWQSTTSSGVTHYSSIKHEASWKKKPLN